MSTSEAAPLPQTEKLDWLRLIRSENVGPVTFFRLLERFGSAGAALDSLPSLAQKGGRAGKLRIPSKRAAEREWRILDQLGGRFIAWGEPDYPPLLGHIEDPPPLLTVLGNVHLLRKKAVAVVGARNASLNGRKIARRLAEELGAFGYLVVSGMARGIDTAAHEGALKSGTIAILGGGVDVVYPPENEALYETLKTAGALVSETAPGTSPQARHFPRRNRIISGVSRGVAVIEASLKSGSLITARLAAEQGRDVFAVPGSPLDPRSKGTNKLIRDGAQLTEGVDDIIGALSQISPTLKEHNPLIFKPVPPTSIPGEAIDEERRLINSLLSPTPVTVDELVRNCQFSPAVVSTVLLEMELAGRLERHPGNAVSLID